MTERRDFPRTELALDVEYLADKSVLGRQATLVNLGSGGACFVAEEALEPGERLRHLHFTLDGDRGSRSYRPAAEVLRCEPREGIGRPREFEIAVAFLDFSPRDAEELSAWILDRLSRDEAFNPRVELERQVTLRFERFDEFVTVVSKNLSRTGMFIQTDDPRSSGSRFEFVLQLGDDFNLVQGQAEVVWTRRSSEGPDRPAGMGIRFLSLDKTSEGVLLRLIGRHIEPSYPRQLATAAEEPLLNAPDLDDDLASPD